MNEIKHKKYRNNLVNILRHNKRTYYNKLLEENKNGDKKSWRIINEVMRNKKNSQTYASEFTQNGIRLTNNTDIVNEFNKFFTNIGKEITNNIPNISSKTINDYLREKKITQCFLNLLMKKKFIM